MVGLKPTIEVAVCVVPDDWDPRSPHVLGDQITAYDEMRARCPVAHSDYLGWSVFRHEDVVTVVNDHDTFSSAVSRYPAVPNGFDPPQHDPYRRLVDRYFTPEHMAVFEPVCRSLARDLVSRIPRGQEVEFIAQFALEYALQAQRAWLGWPEYTVDALRHWTARNHRATLHREREELDAVAAEFDSTVRRVLADHRARPPAANGILAVASSAESNAESNAAPNAVPTAESSAVPIAALGTATSRTDDVTSQLLSEKINGVPLTDEEIVSILRNWTVGELGTMSASVGILVAYLAEHPALQDELRKRHTKLDSSLLDSAKVDSAKVDGANRNSAVLDSTDLDGAKVDGANLDSAVLDNADLDSAELDRAVDEILRMHSPLIANRRVATRDVKLGGRTIKAGERVNVNWASANRDESVFGDPDEYQPQRNAANNVLYGRGIHDCPGAPLARLELRIVVEELLAATSLIAKTESVGHETAAHDYAAYPASGFRILPIILT